MTGPTLRARVTLPDTSTGDRWQARLVDDDERARLAGTLGRLLRASRLAAGLGVRGLARHAAASPSTVSALESGRVRPRPQMLRDLAAVVDPDGTAGLAAALLDAANGSLRPDTEAGLRRRSDRTKRRAARLRMLAHNATTRTTGGDVRTAAALLDGLNRTSRRRGIAAQLAALRAFDAAEQEQARQRAARQAAAVVALRRATHDRPRSTTPDVVRAVAAYLSEEPQAARASLPDAPRSPIAGSRRGRRRSNGATLRARDTLPNTSADPEGNPPA